MTEPIHLRRCGTAGILGVFLLGASFSINPAPPAGATQEALVAFAQQHAHYILLGGWLQVVGTALLAAFALGVAAIGRPSSASLKFLTAFGLCTLMAVNLIEVTLYTGALFPSPANMMDLCLSLIASVQHLYFIVAAPAVFFPFGTLLAGLGYKVLGWLGIALGALFFVVGLATVFQLRLPDSITILGAAQAPWWLATAAIVGFKKPGLTP